MDGLRGVFTNIAGINEHDIFKNEQTNYEKDEKDEKEEKQLFGASIVGNKFWFIR